MLILIHGIFISDNFNLRGFLWFFKYDISNTAFGLPVGGFRLVFPRQSFRNRRVGLLPLLLNNSLSSTRCWSTKSISFSTRLRQSGFPTQRTSAPVLSSMSVSSELMPSASSVITSVSSHSHMAVSVAPSAFFLSSVRVIVSNRRSYRYAMQFRRNNWTQKIGSRTLRRRVLALFIFSEMSLDSIILSSTAAKLSTSPESKSLGWAFLQVVRARCTWSRMISAK